MGCAATPSASQGEKACAEGHAATTSASYGLLVQSAEESYICASTESSLSAQLWRQSCSSIEEQVPSYSFVLERRLPDLAGTVTFS